MEIPLRYQGAQPGAHPGAKDPRHHHRGDQLPPGGETEADGEKRDQAQGVVEGHIHRGIHHQPVAFTVALQQHGRPQRTGGTGEHAEARLAEAENGQRELAAAAHQRHRQPGEYEDKQADECRQPAQVQGLVDLCAQPAAGHRPGGESRHDGQVDGAPAKSGPGEIAGQLGQRVQGQEGGRGHQARHDHQQQHPAAHADHRGEAGGKENYRHQGQFRHCQLPAEA